MSGLSMLCMILFFNIFFGSYFAMQVCSECTASFPGLPLLDVVNVFCLISDLDYTDGTDNIIVSTHMCTRQFTCGLIWAVLKVSR